MSIIHGRLEQLKLPSSIIIKKKTIAGASSFTMPRTSKRLKQSRIEKRASPSPTQHDDSTHADEHKSPAKTSPMPSDEVDAATINLTDDSLLDEEEMPEDGQAPANKKAAGQSYTLGGGYNALKSFNGQYYSGMAVGGSHTWNYDGGVWHETKEEPDLWKIDYKTTKRRARKAPEKSGAPVGTEYHWLIVAHQVSLITVTRHRTSTKQSYTACPENRCKYIRNAS
jgi:hypothetical protein